MLRYLFIAFTLIFGALAAIYFWVGVPRVYEEILPEFSIPHSYHDPERSVENIQIAAFYFVPKNKSSSIAENWEEVLRTSLGRLQQFHSLQFQGRSAIRYTIFREPVIGQSEALVYDTDNTQHGNPRALVHISEELEARGVIPSRSQAEYPVLFIMYEGVGAAGGVIYESELESVIEIARELGLREDVIFEVDIESVDGFFLLNREFLTGRYGPTGVSILAHEFYHTIGLADSYEPPDEIPTSEDIMGLGRLRPIEKTYISRGSLKGFGL